MERELLLALMLLVGSGVVFAQRAGGQDYPPPEPPEEPSTLGRGIQRAMTLMATSTPEERHRVKVLFYGQSITKQDWWKEVAAELRRRYPNADLTIENLSLGGFSSQRLVRTAEYDLYPCYPDLLIFHVFGDHRRYEDIIRRTRERTTAEIAIWNDHVTRLPSEEQEEKGMVGGKQWGEKMSFQFIPSYAEKYGCYLMDIRTAWRRYLDRHGLKPQTLLRDGVHLNEYGNFLLAELIKERLLYNPEVAEDWSDMVRLHRVGQDLHWKDGRLTLEFTGNRVDALSAWPGGGERPSARVLIDGENPGRLPRLYYHARPSGTPHIDWPAIMRIGWEEPLLLETWSLRAWDFSDDAEEFKFEVSGSKTGSDGSGVSTERFVSDSGRVLIEPNDWVFAYDRRVSEKPMPGEVEVTWKARPLFVDRYLPEPVVDSSRECPTTLVQGLANGPHTLQLVSDNGEPVPIHALRVYEPPVK